MQILLFLRYLAGTICKYIHGNHESWNEQLDFSHYMFAWGDQNSPAGAITQNSAANNWANRFCRYIPGYKWQDSTNWKIEPAIAIKDLTVNPNVQPGDVFVMGKINATGESGYPWFTSKQLDVDFGSHNPWNEDAGTAIRPMVDANWYLFRIENDSVLKVISLLPIPMILP